MALVKNILISILILAVGVAGFQWLNRDEPASGPAARGGLAAEQATPSPAERQPSSEAESASSSEGNGENQNGGESNEQSQNQNRRAGGGLRGGRFAQQASTAVELLVAEPKMQNGVLTVYGLIEAENSATIHASSHATIEAIQTIEGSRISAGQLLVQMSSDDTEEQLRQREASLRELDARIRNAALTHENNLAALEIEQELVRIAKNTVDRFTSLNSQQLSTSTDYESALRTYQSQLLSLQSRQLVIAQYEDSREQLQAQREQLLSQIRQSRQLVDDLSVIAPFDGLIAQLYVTSGQSLNAGEAVVELFDPDSLVLYVRVPVRYRLDQTPLTSILAQDTQGHGWQASAIRPINESGAQRLTLTLADDQQAAFLPGTYVELTLQYPLSQPTIEVPVTAIYDQQRLYVYQPQSRSITGVDVSIVGQTENGYLISSEPLEPGTSIVTTRLKNPLTGMAVSVIGGGRGDRL